MYHFLLPSHKTISFHLYIIFYTKQSNVSISSATSFQLLVTAHTIQAQSHCAFPIMPYNHKYYPKPFSDAFAFGRVLLFANSRPKLDLPFQIILGKKINAPPFPLSRIFNAHKSKQRCAYRFVGNLQVLVGRTRHSDRADTKYPL